MGARRRGPPVACFRVGDGVNRQADPLGSAPFAQVTLAAGSDGGRRIPTAGLAVGLESTIVDDMSTIAEIETAIERLSPEQQRTLADWLNSRMMPETPAMMAALDVGIRSLETEPTVPAEDVRRKIKAWATG